jgi:Glycosyltransferase family 87
MNAINRRRGVLAYLIAMLLLDVVVAWNARDLIQKGYPDFSTFYAAGITVREHLGPEMYDEATQYRIEQRFSSGVTIRQGALPYIHPPFEALLFVPLTALSYVWAYLLWDLIGLVALGLSVRFLRDRIPLLQQASTTFWLLASLAVFPVFIGFLQGQDSMLVLLVLVMVYLSLSRRADFRAGCWIGLGLFRFHLMLPLILLLLWQRRGRAIAGLASVSVLVIGLSALAAGWQSTVRYPLHVWRLEKVMGVHGTVIPLQLANLRGLLTWLAPFLSKLTSDAILLVVSLMLLLFTALAWQISRADTFDLGFAFTMIVTVLISYHTMPYDLVILILPLILLGNHLFRAGRLDVALLAPMLLMFLTPLHMLLLFRAGYYCAVALIIVWWGWVAGRELVKRSGDAVGA